MDNFPRSAAWRCKAGVHLLALGPKREKSDAKAVPDEDSSRECRRDHRIRRRDFITLFSGAAASSTLWPLTAQAQQDIRVRRIGVLLPYNEQDARWAFFTAFKQRLADLHWVENRTMRLEIRLTSGNTEEIGKAAAELAATSPDIIFGNTNAVAAALKRATTKIPVVFAGVSDPVGGGIVASLSRPGGNVTGFQSGEGEIAGKWLQVLKEIAPGIRRVAFVYNPVEPVNVAWLRVAESVAPSLGVSISAIPVSSAAEIEPALTAFGQQPNGGFVVAPHSVTTGASQLFIALAERLHLPAIYYFRVFTARGGLVSYGPDIAELYRNGATYVDRILRGAEPGELPVQLPTKYQLVVNLKTAKVLDITVPPTLLARADEVIE
jgi:putative ABC transport system substrate-binding protein